MCCCCCFGSVLVPTWVTFEQTFWGPKWASSCPRRLFEHAKGSGITFGKKPSKWSWHNFGKHHFGPLFDSGVLVTLPSQVCKAPLPGANELAIEGCLWGWKWPANVYSPSFTHSSLCITAMVPKAICAVKRNKGMCDLGKWA